MAAVIVALVMFAGIGFVMGRWWTLVVPLLAWPLYFLGLRADWWGAGVGDGWEYALAATTLASVAAAAVGVMTRRLGRLRTRRTA